jgi:hypothetical protein
VVPLTTRSKQCAHDTLTDNVPRLVYMHEGRSVVTTAMSVHPCQYLAGNEPHVICIHEGGSVRTAGLLIHPY